MHDVQPYAHYPEDIDAEIQTQREMRDLAGR